MPLQCNIDSRGKMVRLIYGVMMLVAGVVILLAWALPTGSVLPWALTVVFLLGGALAIFEARTGWCAVRAMGFKTPV